MVSTSVFGFVVAGSIASTMMFAKIAADHENRADFSSDMRNGMETLSFDVRNADAITNRTDTSFTLTFPTSGPVNYTYDNIGVITRTQDGQSRDVFRSVDEFDVLTSAADEPTGDVLNYDKDELSIETLSFSAGRGSSNMTRLKATNFSLSMRND
ncbi:hypothetical protein DDZ13_04835 [Coraliomargarita sinensis]|uniref:Uncharacterized protein n=2 Tax=Coraliomargarita sinensis TaxID=2174842 RepID=A0A317ZFW2_9BACT|nr:hypothetical protein DDZ13_04835 [Coraliomargarita sinensis]